MEYPPDTFVWEAAGAALVSSVEPWRKRYATLGEGIPSTPAGRSVWSLPLMKGVKEALPSLTESVSSLRK
jgi:hypothetical protein